jgi:hypothetical protein
MEYIDLFFPKELDQLSIYINSDSESYLESDVKLDFIPVSINKKKKPKVKID